MQGFLRWFRAGLLLGAAAFSPLSAAEPGHPMKPLLWKIERNDLKKPSYLFGTIHVSTPAIAKLHPIAEKAFVSADVLYTEIPLDPKAQLDMMPLFIRKDGKTLTESIGANLSKDLDAELKVINPALDSTPFQTLKTWAVAMTLPVLKFQMEGQTGIDPMLWERAKKENKQTAALETAESQLGLFEEFSEKEQIDFLEDILKQMKADRAAGVNSSDDLVNAYISGDQEKVQAEIDKSMVLMSEGEHKALGDRFIKRFLTDRDVSMATTIDARLREAPDKIHFFAVGTGHYVGKPGIGGNLTEKGYRITRIQD